MEKRFYSVREASQYSSLSSRFLYDLIQKRQIKHYKIGRRIVLDVEDLQNFILNHTRDEIDWDEKAREILKG
jgi:excisionase family DNA binding protein